jgi:hypothetical protein
MQVMLDMSAQDANRERYNFSHKKSKVLAYNSSLRPQTWKEVEPFSMAKTPIEVVSEQEHLGVNRSTQSNTHHSKERITLAR